MYIDKKKPGCLEFIVLLSTHCKLQQQNENMYLGTLSVRLTCNTLKIINVHIKSIWRLLIMISGVRTVYHGVRS